MHVRALETYFVKYNMICKTNQEKYRRTLYIRFEIVVRSPYYNFFSFLMLRICAYTHIDRWLLIITTR